MHSRTIVLAVALFAIPLSILAAPDQPQPPAPVVQQTAAGEQTTINGHVLTDAPVSTLLPEHLPPVDRAAQPGARALAAGPVNATPFSDAPTGTLSGGGVAGSQGGRTLASPDADGVTPNLGR